MNSRGSGNETLDNSAVRKERERVRVIESERGIRILCVYVWSVRFYREMQKNQGTKVDSVATACIDGLSLFYVFYYLVKKIRYYVVDIIL